MYSQQHYKLLQLISQNTSENKREISEGREGNNIVVADDDGWTLVSRKR